MSRTIHSLTFIILLLLTSKQLQAQVFWTENFGTGCSQGNLAAGAVATPSNGAWSVTPLATAPGNGAQSNVWFISATEAGMAVGACGDGCLNNPALINRSLHVGSNISTPLPLVDPGAAYLAGGTSNTNIRAESPLINCTGYNNITLNFSYLLGGIAGSDYVEFLYSQNGGATWSILFTPAIPAGNAGCAPQGQWVNYNTVLPATANNNANVKIGYRWQNMDPTGNDPSVAIDSISLSAANLSLAITPSVACVNQTMSAVLTSTIAGTTSYMWGSSPSGAVITGTTPTGTSATVSFPSTGTYSVVVVGFVGATPTYSAVQQVSIVASPVISIAPANATICAGSSTILTASGAGSYTWNTGPTTSTISVSPVTNTGYTVTGGVGSCTAIATTSVFVQTFTPGITASPSVVCVGQSSTLTASPSGGTYQWVQLAPSAAVLGTSQTQIVSPTVNSVYGVSITLGACSGTISTNVNVAAAVPVNLSTTSASVCPGQTATLTANGAVNYTWSPMSSLTLISSSVAVAAPTMPTTYSVIGDNGAGCTGTASITIQLSSVAALVTSANYTAVCPGFNSTVSASGGTSYTWTTSNGTFSVPINQPSVAVGPGTYSVVADNGTGCLTSSIVTIGVASPLNLQLTQSNPTVCIVSNYPKLSSPDTIFASGASFYSWVPCSFNYMNLCIGPQVIVRPPTSTCFTVTGSTAICSGSAVICVTVMPQFTVEVTPPQPMLCIGDTLKLCASQVGTLATGPSSAFSYMWTEPSNAPPPSLDNNMVACVNAFPQNSGTYTLEVYDAVACVSLPKLASYTVLPRPILATAIPTIAGVATNTLCYVGNSLGSPNTTLTLSGSVTNTNLPNGVVPTFTWYAPPTYTNPVSIVTPSTGLPNSGINTNTIIVTAPKRLPDVNTYTVVVGYNGIPGCKEIDTVSVRSVDCRSVTAISFTTALPNDTICSRDCIVFLNNTDTLAGGPQTYTWTFSGGTPSVSSVQNPVVCYNLPGSYNIQVTVCNPYPVPLGSCRTVGRANYIKVVDRPNVTVIPPGSIASTDSIKYGATVTYTVGGANSYQWYANNYFIPPPTTGTAITISPIKSTLVWVVGSNSKNCTSADSVWVIVDTKCGDMFIPDAFSPNGDGHNDVLYVRGKCLESLTLMIYNRWGEKVFETNDINIGWDGTYKGELLNTAVFVYRLEGKTHDGNGYTMKGNVTLIR
ncbi:MAG: gliding motility-associated C-terminal domain-containing protein [Bacteroidetes bacterium]|nr:gliding motility-associated C-terminal domain-containing protein [Bacteroidota bacterium]